MKLIKRISLLGKEYISNISSSDYEVMISDEQALALIKKHLGQEACIAVWTGIGGVYDTAKKSIYNLFIKINTVNTYIKKLFRGFICLIQENSK